MKVFTALMVVGDVPVPRDAHDRTTLQPPYADARKPLQHWLIFTGLTVFGFVLLWWFGLLARMVAADRTHISLAIVVLYTGTSLHCLWRTVAVSREDDAARRVARIIADGRGISVAGAAVEMDGSGRLPEGLVAGHIRDLALKAEAQGTRLLDQTLLLRGLAARFRGPNGFGAFASDTLMKLGLVGTIIGFIVMLAPIAKLSVEGANPTSRAAWRKLHAWATAANALISAKLLGRMRPAINGFCTTGFSAAAGLSFVAATSNSMLPANRSVPA